jgi:hypothetical protein
MIASRRLSRILGQVPAPAFQRRFGYQANAGSLSAISREIGRTIIEALVFAFEVIQHRPRCQSKQCYSGYDDLFENVVVHGFCRFPALFVVMTYRRLNSTIERLQSTTGNDAMHLRPEDSSHRNSAKRYEPAHIFR